jgi:predicted CXXCH cytochrome family protein
MRDIRIYRKFYMKLLRAVLFASVAVLLGAALALAAGKGDPSHMDSFENPEGCAGCHAGRGAPGTPLLKGKREQLCFRCHGTFSLGRARRDIESVLAKSSRHPILETSQYHVQGEVLPENENSMLRHVACADCHAAHLSNSEVPWRGSRGYIPGKARLRQPGAPPIGLRLQRSSEEYELCYLCHSESTNLPIGAERINEFFDTSNQSYHPVETPGRNTNVPSLVRALSITDIITCTDCHGNNDSLGPKGPHGSDYSPILVADYRTEDGPEDPLHYELCYMCHDRRSVLGDESFIRHNLHVVSENTSCFTCHDSHGSTDNPHLIDFNAFVVSPSLTAGGPVYMPSIGGNPRCYLACHDADHNTTGITILGVTTPWP